MQTAASRRIKRGGEKKKKDWLQRAMECKLMYGAMVKAKVK